jgi:hypothetical protein
VDYRASSTAAFTAAASFTGAAVGNVAAGIDANGNAVVAWLDGGIHYAMSTGGTFGPAQSAPLGAAPTFNGRGSDPQRDHGPRAFRDNAGNVVLVYRNGNDATVAHRSPAGVWDSAVLPGGAATDVQADADPASRRLIVGYTTATEFWAFEGSTDGSTGTVQVTQPASSQDIFSVAVERGGSQDMALWRDTSNALRSASCLDDFKPATVGPSVGAGVVGVVTGSDQLADYAGGPGWERAARNPGGAWKLTPFAVANFGTLAAGGGYGGNALGLFVDYPNDTGITGFPYSTTAKSSAACAAVSSAPAPVAFKSVDARVVSGTVLIKFPSKRGRSARATAGFVPLKGVSSIPLGSIVDASLGRLAITAAANRQGGRQTSQFYDGVFEVKQQITEEKTRRQRAAKKAKLTTELVVKGMSASTCTSSRSATTSAAKSSKKVLGKVWGSGHSRVRTVGHHSATTVRGTIWLTEDRCDGTLTTVKTGKVSVQDFRTKKTVTVTTGHSYLARAERAGVKIHTP